MNLVVDAIFCDEIRQEVTGKFLLIGVYPGDLVPPVIPTKFPMAMMLRVHGLPAGNHEFEFVLKSPNGEPAIGQKDFFYVADSQSPMVMIFSGFAMTVEGPGEIIASVKVAGKELVATSLRVTAPKTP